jgi:hypothetical protein
MTTKPVEFTDEEFETGCSSMFDGLSAVKKVGFISFLLHLLQIVNDASLLREKSWAALKKLLRFMVKWYFCIELKVVTG